MPFEEQLSDAMNRAMSEVRPPADLAAGGLARGRRMHRTRLLQTGGTVAAVALIAVTGSVAAANVFQDPAERPAPLTPATSGKPRPPTHKELVQIVSRLLPSGETRWQRLEYHANSKDLPTRPPSVSGIFNDGKGASAFTVSLHRYPAGAPRGRADGTCLPVQLRPYDDCRGTVRKDGSTLAVTRGYTRPQSNQGEKLWSAVLTRTDGVQIRLEQFNSAGEKSAAGPTRPAPALTPRQMEAVVTSPAWDSVVARVPLTGEADPGSVFSGSAQLAAKLRRLLPAGVRITDPAEQDGYATLILEDGRGRTTIEVSVRVIPKRGELTWQPPGCAERLRQDPVDAMCRKGAGPDGAIVYAQEHAAEKPGSGVTVRTVDVFYPDRLRVVVTVANGTSAKSGPKTRSTPALTLDRLRAIATDPSWRK